ncbi:MAG: helix-turn-helix transcriptional regulator [SAR324 cluster bacterium]|nr:helix-turn-helix transcriptional regulator [SAR324 cluster bacterium]
MAAVIKPQRKERFSRFLEYLKLDKGFSLSKVAENIGISVQGLYKIKRGESNPSRQTVMLLNIKYGLNTEWFETGKGEMMLREGSDQIERSDEIIMELLRMKNLVIEELSNENASLKEKNEQMKKKVIPKTVKKTGGPSKAVKKTGPAPKRKKTK